MDTAEKITRNEGRQRPLFQTPTTAQQLGSIVKSVRDIMRKDKGLNGDLDRLPMLTWILFLKFLDDMEKLDEMKADIRGERFRPAIEAPYRWRDWADGEGNTSLLTGGDLIAFINNDEATRPDGVKGPGLFAYLRALQASSSADRRTVISTVFRGIVNRMVNGYLLRDIINKVNAIHFTSSDEIHTLGHLYESMLKELENCSAKCVYMYSLLAGSSWFLSITASKALLLALF